MPWAGENIVVNLAIEIGLLFGLFAGIVLTVGGFIIFSGVWLWGLLVLGCFAYFSARHIQELFKKGKKIQVLIFLTFIILTIILTIYVGRPKVFPAFFFVLLAATFKCSVPSLVLSSK
jgi:hypothetical protein